MDRKPLSIDDCALYPLFTNELLRLMRTLISASKQTCVATAIVVKARLP